LSVAPDVAHLAQGPAPRVVRQDICPETAYR
jgi:hypothetical protein